MTDLAQAVKILADFCGPRDLSELNQAALQKAFGRSKVDVCVLFGGSILSGASVFAQAIREGIAKTYLIVGGYGHTTQALIDQLPNDFQGRISSESELFQDYVKQYEGVSADLLETASTNCGNNITYLLDLLENKSIQASSFLLIQDATMQRRMAATLEKYSPSSTIIQYASYQVKVIENEEGLAFVDKPLGMWQMDRYISLLLGEIPRLRDDKNGYGPKGQGFLAHVSIPDEVETAYAFIQEKTGLASRQANPAYKS